MKIALFGGSFDPPYEGHDAIVKEALAKLDIDKLIITPIFTNPFKKGFFADEKQRFAWVNEPWGDLEKVEVCDFEIKQKHPVPSIENVEYLYKIHHSSKFYLLISADHLEKLHLWHDFERLNSLVEFIIANHNDIEIPKNFKGLKTNIRIASFFIRGTLDTHEVCDEIKNEVKNYYEKLQENWYNFKNLKEKNARKSRLNR